MQTCLVFVEVSKKRYYNWQWYFTFMFHPYSNNNMLCFIACCISITPFSAYKLYLWHQNTQGATYSLFCQFLGLLSGFMCWCLGQWYANQWAAQPNFSFRFLFGSKEQKAESRRAVGSANAALLWHLRYKEASVIPFHSTTLKQENVKGAQCLHFSVSLSVSAQRAAVGLTYTPPATALHHTHTDDVKLFQQSKLTQKQDRVCECVQASCKHN